MAPIIKTFNCISTSTPIVPIKRPYYCCGWYDPPKSFSGQYICQSTGSPPLQCYVNTGSSGIGIKLELESECGGGTFNGDGVFVYSIKSTIDFRVMAFVHLQLCTLPDGSNTLYVAQTEGADDDYPNLALMGAVFGFQDPFPIGTVSFECSKNPITKEYKFNYKSIFFANYEDGSTFYRFVELDKVEIQ